MYSHQITYAIMNPNFISVKCITKGIYYGAGEDVGGGGGGPSHSMFH